MSGMFGPPIINGHLTLLALILTIAVLIVVAFTITFLILGFHLFIMDQLQIKYKVLDVQAYLHKKTQELVQIFNVEITVLEATNIINIVISHNDLGNKNLADYLDCKIKEYVLKVFNQDEEN